MPTRNQPLSLRQEAFVKWYTSKEVKGNGTEAARRAGYSPNTAKLTAHQLIRKPAVKKAIAERIDWILKGSEVTIEKVLDDIEDSRSAAAEAGDHRTALIGSKMQGDFLQMWRQKVEHLTRDEEGREVGLRVITLPTAEFTAGKKDE